MSLRKRLRTKDESTVDMTPMLEIVFIMLIFFIVTATFLDESGLDFTSPPQNPCDDCPPGQAINVYVDAQNNVTVEQIATELTNAPYAIERELADKPAAQIILTAHYLADLDPVVSIKDRMQAAGKKTIFKVVQE